MAMDFYELLKGTVPEWFKPWFEWLHDTVSVWIFWLCVAVAALGILLYISRTMWREWSWVKHLWHLLRRKGLPKATTFMVAMTHFDGDEKDAIRKQLMDALHDLPFEVSGFDRFPKFEFEVAQKEQLQEQHDQARKWLKESGTDLLIWGKVLPAVAQKERRLRLYFTAKDSDQQNYKLLTESQVHDFPVAARDPLEAMIRSQVLARLSSFPDAKPIAAELQKEVERIRRMAAEWPPGDTRAALHGELGIALLTIGRQLGDASKLNDSVCAFNEELKEYKINKVLVECARVQNNLSIALLRLSELENESINCNKAKYNLHEAINIYTNLEMPFELARTQSNLATVFLKIGIRESNTSHIKQAIEIYNKVLQIQTRQNAPLEWVESQNNLCIALANIGEIDNNQELLKQAASICCEILKIYKREYMPLYWAGAHYNLAKILRILGEREEGIAKLNEAITSLQEAIKERKRELVPVDWAATQSELGLVLFLLGKRENSVVKMKSAAVALNEALTVCTRERDRIVWAATKNNLGTVLSNLGQIEYNIERFEEAVLVFNDSLQVRTYNLLPNDWVKTQKNLSDALFGIVLLSNDVEKKCIYLHQAEEAFTKLLTVLENTSDIQVNAIKDKLRFIKEQLTNLQHDHASI